MGMFVLPLIAEAGFKRSVKISLKGVDSGLSHSAAREMRKEVHKQFLKYEKNTRKTPNVMESNKGTLNIRNLISI